MSQSDDEKSPLLESRHLPESPPLTLSDILNFVKFASGCPRVDQAISLDEMAKSYAEEQIIFILQEWTIGRIESYDPGTGVPVLSPRQLRRPLVSWDYVCGIIPIPGVGFGVSVKNTEPDLSRYGTFRCRPDGSWSFALHSSDIPALDAITEKQPVSLQVSLLLRNDHTEAEDHTTLFLHIAREPRAGLTVTANYEDCRFHGYSRSIRDLAENCISGRVFGQTAPFSFNSILWIDAAAWFFSTLFTQDLPYHVAHLANGDTQRNLVVHQARSAIVRRLATMIFDRGSVNEALHRFPKHSGELFAYPDRAIELEYQADKQQKKGVGRPPRSDWHFLIALLAIIDQNEPELLAVRESKLINRLIKILSDAKYKPDDSKSIAPSRPTDYIKSPHGDLLDFVKRAAEIYKTHG